MRRERLEPEAQIQLDRREAVIFRVEESLAAPAGPQVLERPYRQPVAELPASVARVNRDQLEITCPRVIGVVEVASPRRADDLRIPHDEEEAGRVEGGISCDLRSPAKSGPTRTQGRAKQRKPVLLIAVTVWQDGVGLRHQEHGQAVKVGAQHSQLWNAWPARGWDIQGRCP